MTVRTFLIWRSGPHGPSPCLAFDHVTAEERKRALSVREIAERDLYLVNTEGAETLLDALARRFPLVAAGERAAA